MVKNVFIRHLIITLSMFLIPNDEMFVRMNYKRKIGRSLNLENPKFFTEKIQWIKLNEKNQLYTIYSDKLLVRDYIEEKIGSRYLIPLLGVYGKFDDINFEELPESFVIQCNHDSGSTFVVNDKNDINIKEFKSFFNYRWKENYYHFTRERHYDGITPKIMITLMLGDSKGINDYKFFCFNGKVKYIQVDSSRFSGHQRSVFDIEWNRLDFKWRYEHCEPIPDKPNELKKMIDICEKLAEPFYFVRVDLYYVDGKIYFGEMTFTPVSGYEKFEKDEYDLEFGSSLILPIERR